MGCGGQIVPPPCYLKKAYEVVRAAGGVCIADEVQTGFARCGSHYWGFQYHNVIPDIVTCGKPMGNGYPIAAVICRSELADAFAATGIEYFNTYGGNSVACTIAEAVYDTIEEGIIIISSNYSYHYHYRHNYHNIIIVIIIIIIIVIIIIIIIMKKNYKKMH